MTEYWLGQDIARRAQLGLYPGQQQRDEDASRREAERQGMVRLLGQLHLSPPDPSVAADIIDALHAVIAGATSMLALVQLDDLVGEIEPINIPGTHREYPNWRRKLSVPLEEIFGDKRWLHLAATMRAAGRDAP